MIRRLSWSQRFAAALAGLTGLVVLVGAGAAAYLASVVARVDTVSVEVLDAEPEASSPPVASDFRTTTSVPGAEPLPDLGSAGPAENYLIIGSDDVSGIGADEAILAGREDEAGQSLADTIMLLRLDPGRGAAALLSVPRDLWVTIEDPDNPFDFKINSAFNLEDHDERADRMVATVKSALDVPVHHYVHVNWAGFRRLVDTIGGVEICFDAPQRDVKTGFIVSEPGLTVLDGDQALAYVRSRTMEQQDASGTWALLDLTADLARIPRQQEFLRQVLDQTSELRSITDLRQGRQLIEATLDAVEIDDTLDLGSLLDLVRRYEAVGSDDLRTYQLDVVDGEEIFRGQVVQVVQLVQTPNNTAALDVFRGIEPGAVTPGRIAVEVTGAGAAATADALVALGFTGADVGLGAGAGGPTSVIRYGPGGEDAALLVAAAVEGRWRYAPDATIVASVLLELGDEPLEVLTELRTPAEEPPTVSIPDAAAPGATTPTPTAPTTTVAPSVCAG